MARKTGKAAGPTRVEQTRHAGDQRVNIPTAELEAFADAEEKQPKKVLYQRNPDLDPQLVWKGKDQQDQHPLKVPSVPIYIQEHISPKALIEDLRATSSAGREQQMDLFGDFNGMEFDERVEFYQHPMKWSNRMILGDSLLAMTSLAEKEGLKGQVQMIYVDPPYGIKFGSNWQVSTKKRDVKDGKLDDATRQPEQVKAFRDTWELGIHSYLSYLRDRFVVTRDLLTDSGSIFVQIGDENVHLVRSLLDEVFGAENFIAELTFQKTTFASSTLLPVVSDYLIWYGRNRPFTKYRELYRRIPEEEAATRFRYVAVGGLDGQKRMLGSKEDFASLREGSVRFMSDNLTSPGASANTSVPFEFDGRTFTPGANLHWKTGVDGLNRLAGVGRLFAARGSLRYVRLPSDFPVGTLNNVWTDTTTGSFADDRIYAVQTVSKVVDRCLLMSTDPGDLVLDPTCGSGTTAVVAERWGRRWITIDTSRVAVALARTRVMSQRHPYYLLADTPEGRRKEEEMSGQVAPPVQAEGDIRKGFVYERVPHVTLKSIAQNPDIREGMTREAIDAAIARHAETEILYDRPYTDPKVIRVAGPFTVESLSPHRVVTDAVGDGNVPAPQSVEDQARFIDMVLDNLRKSGVQNQVKDQRLQFDSLDRFAGRAIQADGHYAEGDTRKRAAVAIGPQYGTVGTELVREAAKEAAGFFDLLVICGFAFEARAEELSHLGNLPIVYARMNADLLLGDALKKTGAGNLFTVFGQPDVDIRTADDGQLQVDIRGIDVYDPTTGEIRSDSPDEIASWFIDTDYNAESFFVRHAYFCGGDRPYERLQKTLKAEIDEVAWESLYSATSRPFPKPASGKIAVKVINHYG
ncbi:MAG: site-specific DNA-methyltransferase, partial [Chloroflexota bacterium]|nr:site-specific DNA-methyltransferase [Chloroflexota bacterium]